ncbi:MAG: transglutaminase family protein [Armatimonadota bacterium]
MRGIGAETTEEGVVTRLPWAMTAAVLTAFAALMLIKGERVLMPLCALAVLLAYPLSARMAGPLAVLAARLVLFTLAALLAFNLRSNGMDEFIDARWTNLLGYLCAAEIVVQTWKRQPGKARLVLLTCGVLLAASNTYQGHWVQLLTPPFILWLTIGVAWYRPRSAVRPRRTHLAAGVLFLAMLGLGYGFNLAVTHYQTALNAWGVQIMTMYPRGRMGISLSPALGRGPGPHNSAERVLRVDGFQSVYYLRGLAFDTYENGHWFPSLLDRTVRTIPPHPLRSDVPNIPMHITKYARLDNLLFTPLATNDISASAMINWSPEYGGPMECSDRDMMDYLVSVAPHGSGIMWAAPTPEQRARMLRVPEELAPGVRKLADEIGRRASSPHDRVQRTILHLITHYKYSTAIDPGAGDPVSNFLLKKDSAHCEYFASAATLLLRCQGVPARYVVGYYAHERQPDGSLVVRQRDAHAWAEAWVDGVGWLTVEATPSGGRPDARREDLPSWWQYVKDWTRDKLQIVVALLNRLRPQHLAIVLPMVLAPYVLLLWRRSRRETRQRRVITYAFPPDRRLAELTTRFNAWLARAERPCPAGTPWQEHLAGLDPDSPAQAREFVRTYNRLRFGPAREDEELAALAGLMAELERGER